MEVQIELTATVSLMPVETTFVQIICKKLHKIDLWQKANMTFKQGNCKNRAVFATNSYFLRFKC